ncbi:MAG TPA: HAD-IIB family hydrolase [Nitrososphaeraceae archaeon]|nr:HAD-IIB family hydrolase [Nitrososphaeraceae archaeon]
MKINALLSDYDGTLCACSVNTQDNTIPERLNDVLFDISEKIPVCILSSKDFGFLHKRIKFANILSCILGIETLHLKKHLNAKMMTMKNAETTTASTIITDCNNFSCIADHRILVDDRILQHNSRILDCLANDILLNFKDVSIERKYISNNETLAGITIDWRHLQDWESFKTRSEPLLKKAIEKQQKLSFNGNTLYTQTYATHPFIDVYAAKCDKGMAFDSIASEISYVKGKGQRIMYLGDSENDNPAFRRADLSIGVLSDDRLNPKLDCDYTVSFDNLSIFLKKLLDNDLVFSDDLLPAYQKLNPKKALPDGYFLTDKNIPVISAATDGIMLSRQVIIEEHKIDKKR